MPGIQKPGQRVESWDDQERRNQPEGRLVCRDDDQRILQALRPRPGDALLDIGCCDGQLLSAAIVFEVDSTGIEDTPEAAAICQRTVPQAKIVLASEVELPFENHQFDLVTALDFMQFFPEPEEGLHEIHRILKPGGRACIVLPNAEFTWAGSASWYSRWNQAEQGISFPLKIWKRMLISSGLTVVAVRPGFPPLSANNAYRPMPDIIRLFLNYFWRLLPVKWFCHFIFYCRRD